MLSKHIGKGLVLAHLTGCFYSVCWEMLSILADKIGLVYIFMKINKYIWVMNKDDSQCTPDTSTGAQISTTQLINQRRMANSLFSVLVEKSSLNSSENIYIYIIF
jgi:hypothetical protein